MALGRQEKDGDDVQRVAADHFRVKTGLEGSWAHIGLSLLNKNKDNRWDYCKHINKDTSIDLIKFFFSYVRNKKGGWIVIGQRPSNTSFFCWTYFGTYILNRFQETVEKFAENTQPFSHTSREVWYSYVVHCVSVSFTLFHSLGRWASFNYFYRAAAQRFLSVISTATAAAVSTQALKLLL